MNVGTVSVELRLLAGQFMRGIQAAISPLKALQEQANSVASSFRFIGGALATGGIAGLVSNLAQAEDAFLGMKAAMSGSIQDANALAKNYQGLQAIVRNLAVETGFSAKEISETATAFLRANISVRQTAESLESVINLAKAEGDDLSDIASIAIDITKAFELTGEEFQHVTDVLVNASLASNVTIRELGESFKYAAGVAHEFDQSVESTAGLLATLADEGQRGSLAGTALRQIFISLQKDFEKVNSTLKRFNVSLFQGGEMSERFDSKFRPLPEILLELGKKAGTAGNFINIFQARALTAALGIADESATAFSRLIGEIGKTGSAANLAAVRSESLVTIWNQVKAAVTEATIALGERGGLLAELKGIATSIRGFFQGLSQLSPRILQFATQLILTTAQVGLFIAGFIALSGAAAALLSPLGLAAQALFAVNQVGKDVSLFEEYSEELGKLANLFGEFISLIGNNIGDTLTDVVGDIFKKLGRAFELFAGNLLPPISTFYQAVADGFFVISDASYEASIGFAKAANANSDLLSEMIRSVQVGGQLKTSLEGLDEGFRDAAQTADLFSVQVGEARAVVQEIQGEITKLGNESVPASQKILELMNSIAFAPGAQGTVDLLQALLHRAQDLEAQLALAGGKNPGELLAEGMKIADAETRKVQEMLGGFNFETQEMVSELERLKAATEAIGGANIQVFDELIAKVKEARAEQQQLFTVEFGRGIQSGISEMVSGLLRGTREAVSAGELLRGALLAEFESLFQQIILKKLVFDQVFKDNFAGLGKFVRETFSNIFSGETISSVISVGKSILSSIGIPSFAEGAVVSGGMLAMVGDAGPSGRGAEAILPLDKLRNMGGGGGETKIILNTDQPADRVSVRELGGQGMEKIIELTVGKVEQNVRQRGSIHRAFLDTTTSRPRTSR